MVSGSSARGSSIPHKGTIFRAETPLHHVKITSVGAGLASECLCLLSYVPQLYSGKSTDFSSSEAIRGLHNPELKWDRLAEGGQEIVVLPVNAPSMLFEPFVSIWQLRSEDP